MTIERGYLEICKTLAPGAFTRNIPKVPQVSFIDGAFPLSAPPAKPYFSVNLSYSCVFTRSTAASPA